MSFACAARSAICHGFDVAIADVTADIAALSLQGPTSYAVLRQAGFAVADLKPFRFAHVHLAGGEVMISRTGFTGDLGYELWVAPSLALALWDLLFDAGRDLGIRPVGSLALNTARLEAGFLIANADFVPAHQAVREDRLRSPFELGLDWLIDWDKGHFTGRRALAAEKRDGNSRWALVGLDVEGNVPAQGALLYHHRKREAGYVTGAAWSPVLKRNIALAQVERRHAEGFDLWVEIYAMRELQYVKLMLPVRIATRPFYAPARRRATPPGPW
jgi:aminomethyltransferase